MFLKAPIKATVETPDAGRYLPARYVDRRAVLATINHG